MIIFLNIICNFARKKISIHDQIDSRNELFPETRPSNELEMMGEWHQAEP